MSSTAEAAVALLEQHADAALVTTNHVRDEVGDHVAVVRAVWSLVNTTSAGDVERRPDIVLETPIPITVYEIQTVGTEGRGICTDTYLS